MDDQIHQQIVYNLIYVLLDFWMGFPIPKTLQNRSKIHKKSTQNRIWPEKLDFPKNCTSPRRDIHSLTLRVVAVDLNILQPCVAVTGTRLSRAKKPRAEQDFGDCGGHHNGGGGDGGGGDGYGRRFAPSADGASRRRLGVGLRGVVSGTPSPNLVIESMSLKWVV